MDISLGEQPDTFSITIQAAAGAQNSWAADVNCTLTGVYFVQAGGAATTVARSKTGANLVNAAGAVTARKVIAFSAVTTIYSFITCREPFVTGDRVWVTNDSAGASIVLLVFES
jgi:hypothetical protein